MKNNIFSGVILTIFTCFFQCGFAEDTVSKSQLTKEQFAQMDKCYRTAMECYVKNGYYNAILQWEQVLKIDPQQLPPQRMISLARTKLKKQLEPVYTKAQDELASGKYLLAWEHYLEYYKCCDPADLEISSFISKLNKISQIKKSVDGDDNIPHLIRLGIKNYLEKNGDLSLSLDALRYVEQLASKDQSNVKLRELVESEYFYVVKSSETYDSSVSIIEKRVKEAADFIGKNQFESAIVYCNRVLMLQPNNVSAINRLGSAYYSLGQKDKAKEYWTKVLSIDPKNVDAKNLLKQK